MILEFCAPYTRWFGAPQQVRILYTFYFIRLLIAHYSAIYHSDSHVLISLTHFCLSIAKYALVKLHLCFGSARHSGISLARPLQACLRDGRDTVCLWHQYLWLSRPLRSKQWCVFTFMSKPVDHKTLMFPTILGGLYIAGSNATIAGLQSVTWDIPLITAASTTGTTATMRNGTSAGGLYLNATSSSVTAVTIASDSTVGITVYGKQLVYYSESNIEAKFWVKQVEINGSSAYMLTWNPGNTLEADITPVNVKIDGPA